jgi:hypothetical protein
VAYFVFPMFIVLHCERAQNICSLEQSNPFRSKVSKMALQDITGAKLETSTSGSGTAYRIWILTRQGSIPFTSYSIGLSENEKVKIVSKINAYLKDPSVSTLEVVEDERLPFFLLSAGIICFGLLPLCFVRTVTCLLDKTTNRFLLKGGGIWGLQRVERHLSDLVEASVGAAKEGGYRMCRIVFKFVSGEKIPLTYYRYRDFEHPRIVVKEINDFLAHR